MIVDRNFPIHLRHPVHTEKPLDRSQHLDKQRERPQWVSTPSRFIFKAPQGYRRRLLGTDDFMGSPLQRMRQVPCDLILEQIDGLASLFWCADSEGGFKA